MPVERRSPKSLIADIERAKRFAADMTDNRERLRLEAIANDLMREMESIRDPSSPRDKLD